MNAQGLELQVEEQDGLVVVSASGYVDASNIETFRSTLMPYADREKIRLLMDCSALHYLNSNSLGILVRLHRKCAAKGGCVALCNLATRLEHTMTMIGLDRLIHRFASREEARAYLDTAVVKEDRTG